MSLATLALGLSPGVASFTGLSSLVEVVPSRLRPGMTPANLGMDEDDEPCLRVEIEIRLANR